MPKSSALQTRRGRPVAARPQRRGAVVVERVLRATAHELSEVGYASLRVDRVADRAGVNKTTIYRRWPTKLALVEAAIRTFAAGAETVDCGSVREDLRQSLLATIARASDPVGVGIMRILQTERAIPEIDVLAGELLAERQQARIAAVERGIARGELPPGTDSELLVDLVSGAVLRRALTFGEPVSEDYLDRLLDVAFSGIEAARSR